MLDKLIQILRDSRVIVKQRHIVFDGPLAILALFVLLLIVWFTR